MTNNNSRRLRDRRVIDYSNLEEETTIITANTNQKESLTIDLTDKDAWDDTELIQSWNVAKQQFLESHLNKRPIKESDKELSWKEMNKLKNKGKEQNKRELQEANNELNNDSNTPIQRTMTDYNNISENNLETTKKLKLTKVETVKSNLVENINGKDKTVIESANNSNSYEAVTSDSSKQLNPDSIDLDDIECDSNHTQQTTQNPALNVQLDKNFNSSKTQEVANETQPTNNSSNNNDQSSNPLNKVQEVNNERQPTNTDINNNEVKENETAPQTNTNNENQNNETNNYNWGEYYNQEQNNNTYYQQQYGQNQFNPFPSNNQGAMDETTTNMLMAWYYAGYYTAIFQEKNNSKE